MTDKITSADIDRVLELDSKRTQGEWEQDISNIDYDIEGTFFIPETKKANRLVCAYHTMTGFDAAFIAAAPLMARIIRQQRDENKDLRRELSESQSLLEAAVKREVELRGLIKGAYAFLVYVPDPTVLAITPDVGRVREDRKIEFLAKLGLVISGGGDENNR